MAFKSPNSHNLQSKNRGETEPKKKLKKIKSNKGQKLLLRTDLLGLDIKSNGSSSDLVKSSFQGGSESEDTSVSSSTSGSSPRDSVIKGGTERKKTLKKNKSNKFARMGSFRPRKYVKSRFDPKQPLVNKENESPTSDALDNKPTRTFSRMASLRSVRVLKSKPSFKSKRPSMRKLSEMPQDLNVERPTCSSTLRGSKFSKKVELHHDEADSEISSVMKVCPYHHCSLHGHSHTPAAPQKRVLYKKRRSMKTQRRNKPESLPAVAVKQSGDENEEVQSRQIDSNEDKDVGSKLCGGKSEKDQNVRENLDETSSECCYEETQGEKSVFETVDTDLNGNECNFTGEEVPDLSKDEQACITKGSTRNDCDEEKEDDDEFSSSLSQSHSFEEFSATREEKNEISASDDESVNGSTRETDSELLKPQLKKSNNFSMWHLIHRQMVSSLATEAETQSHKGADDKNVDKQVDVSDLDTKNQELELRKVFAIKLVREAIEKILLPEVQDQSSDDQSVTSDITSEKELFGKNEDAGEEKNILTSENSSPLGDDLTFEARRDNNNISGPEEERKATKERKESEKKAPKSWSYLKKVILLQRFVKELEKVKKFEPKKPQHLPLEPDPEAEKVSLRRQMMKEKKNSEEWMLDYAIRQVVSELAPTQKRKVALLVKAFETVVPPQEDRQTQVRFSKRKSSQKIFGVQNELDESFSVANDKDLKADEIIQTNLDHGHANSNIDFKQSAVGKLSMIKIEDSNNEIVSYDSEKAPVHEKDREVHQDMISSLSSNLDNGDSPPSAKFVELDNLHDVHMKPSHISNSSATDGDIKAITNNIVSTLDHEPLEQVMVTEVEKNGESKPEKLILREFPLLVSPNGGDKTQLDKQKHIKMWHMICRHVVSEIAEKVGTEILLDGPEEGKEQVDDDKLPDVKDSATDNNVSHQRIEFSKSDAVKLVQEAVDEILLPNIQDDSSDTQSTLSDDSGGLSRLNSTDSIKDVINVENGVQVDQEDKGYAHNSINTQKDEKAALVEQPKNWRKLKKLMLLKRSIKALEKVRKFNPQPVQLLPLRRDLDAEKVDLRPQMMDERKKAEQWMLDYAVQHIVTKLTPARKRRVAMLVEAFEAVVPLPEI